ncbi:MAG: metal ABC transporter substrate-binding protein [Planctomycetota bacterium]|nr:metal ABC transporter substrate-binding protein [Planctomycetota bacterium]
MTTNHAPLLGLVAGALLLAATGCDGTSGEPRGAAPEASGPPTVFADNFPLQSFAQVMGGTEVEVNSPCLEGESAVDYRPTPEQIIEIQDASLILLNGAEFANWTANASLPGSRTIITANAFRDQWLESTHHHHHDHDHQHGPEGEGVHDHAHWASHTWLDPNLAREQAAAAAAGMQNRLPGVSTVGIRARAEDLMAELGALADQAALIRGLELPPIIGSEPVYEYLASACGLDLHEADWHWNEPTPHDGMESLRNLVLATGARHLLVPSAPTAERLEVLRELGLEPVLVMPLANPPTPDGTETVTTLMGRNLAPLQALAPGQSVD